MSNVERICSHNAHYSAASLILAICTTFTAHATPQLEPKVRPSGAQLLAGDLRHLSPQYAHCMAAATNIEARRRCVDAELKIHDDALNAAYLTAQSKMSTSDRNILRGLQRQWQEQRDTRCPQAGDATVSLDAQQCRTHMTLLRSRQLLGSGAAGLVAEAKETPPQAQVATYTADAAPDQQNRIILQPGQGMISPPLKVTFKVADCSTTETVSTCQVKTMKVKRGARNVAVTGVQPRLTRAGAHQNGTGAVLLNAIDLNGDGALDLQVWQDNNGVYNVPVYAFYLFDANAKRYVRASALEAAIGGRDIDHIDNGRLVLRAKISPCEREDKVIQLRETEPRILLERRYDTCNGQRSTESELLR